MKANFMDVDDEVTVLFETPATRKKATAAKLNAITVEDYHTSNLKPKFLNGSSPDTPYFVEEEDDVIFVTSSSDKKGKRKIFEGESSISKSSTGNKGSSRIPINSMCEICADDIPRFDMFRILGCNHYYCCSCIEKYVATKLQENFTTIKCPFTGCNGILEPYHCREILPKQVFERWGDALCEAVILGSEKFYCPFKDCSAMLITGNKEDVLESECPNCNRLFCARCKVPWHAEIRCEDFQKMNKDERSNEDILLMKLANSKKWKRCPECRALVEKRSGCSSVLCRCNHVFNYGS